MPELSKLIDVLSSMHARWGIGTPTSIVIDVPDCKDGNVYGRVVNNLGDERFFRAEDGRVTYLSRVRKLISEPGDTMQDSLESAPVTPTASSLVLTLTLKIGPYVVKRDQYGRWGRTLLPNEMTSPTGFKEVSFEPFEEAVVRELAAFRFKYGELSEEDRKRFVE